MHCITCAFQLYSHALQMSAVYVELLCVVKFGLGWAHDVFYVTYHMLMHFNAYIPLIIYILIYWFVWCFFACLFLSPSLFLTLVCFMAPKCKSTSSQNSFRSGASSSILSPPMSGFLMRRPSRTSWRTFHDETFIWNAKSFYWIFLILTFSLSFTVGVGSHCVASRSLVPLWSYKSFTPIRTYLILQL